MKKETGFLILFIAYLCIILFGVSVALITQSVDNNADYHKYKDVAVSVSAIVSDVDVYEDTDKNTEYKTYIDYEYNGKKYSRIYWDTFSFKKTVGQQVTVKIFSDAPTHIFEDDIGARDLNLATYMFCVAMNFLFFCIYEARKSKKEDILKVITIDKVYEATKPKLTLMMIFTSIAFARIILIYIYPSFINYDNSRLSTLIVIVVSLVLFVYKLIICKTYSLNNYNLISKRCTNKGTEGGVHEYGADYLIFGDKKIYCTNDLFHETRPGDAFLLLLNKKGEILKAYNAKNWTKKDVYTNVDLLHRKKCMKNLGISVIASLIIAIMFVAYFSVILRIMQ